MHLFWAVVSQLKKEVCLHCDEQVKSPASDVVTINSSGVLFNLKEAQRYLFHVHSSQKVSVKFALRSFKLNYLCHPVFIRTKIRSPR